MVDHIVPNTETICPHYFHHASICSPFLCRCLMFSLYSRTHTTTRTTRQHTTTQHSAPATHFYMSDDTITLSRTHFIQSGARSVNWPRPMHPGGALPSRCGMLLLLQLVAGCALPLRFVVGWCWWCVVFFWWCLWVVCVLQRQAKEIENLQTTLAGNGNESREHGVLDKRSVLCDFVERGADRREAPKLFCDHVSVAHAWETRDTNFLHSLEFAWRTSLPSDCGEQSVEAAQHRCGLRKVGFR